MVKIQIKFKKFISLTFFYNETFDNLFSEIFCYNGYYRKKI